MAQYTSRAIFPNDHPPFTRYEAEEALSIARRRILKSGGNAADAAVAVAAAMNMTELASTGIGGDMFCLYYDVKTKKVRALNGSGRSPENTTLAQIKAQVGSDKTKIPINNAVSVTVPGAAAGWVDAIEMFGSGHLSLADVLAPAIELGEQGFPVSELSARMWQNAESQIKLASPNYREMLKSDARVADGARAPMAGEIFKNPSLANTFRRLAKDGKDGFYTGEVAAAIVEVLKAKGAHMELSDLKRHKDLGPQEMQPISLRFRGQNVSSNAAHKLSGVSSEKDHFVEVWEHPPNGQGIVALMALGLLEELENTGNIPTFSFQDHNGAAYLHAMIECLRIAFMDANWWVTDPAFMTISPEQLVSHPYLAERAKLFQSGKAGVFHTGKLGGSPAQNHSDTVYFAVVDQEGNAMSFINSNFREFGSCIVPKDCGFTLQNRGSGFELGPEDHPNVYRGGKRPYHTIIPGIATYGTGAQRELHSVLGVMGGLMQPQGHVQVLLNMEVFGMNPQQALDAPRICIAAGPPGNEDPTLGTVFVEEGIDQQVVLVLRQMGHTVKVMEGWERFWFGRGQIIRRHMDEDTGQVVYSGGSDPRGDGCVLVS